MYIDDILENKSQIVRYRINSILRALRAYFKCACDREA